MIPLLFVLIILYIKGSLAVGMVPILTPTLIKERSVNCLMVG